ncbi:Branched-chain amino acid aminotransferase/4-amino-4-deoxychorismate lyase [[Actinobacillus] rossii]|uniref:Branched-chain amino acid aminotransferase/4-amino-4-deoxychorismate lyase n=1 Tax=[Actinobacillus] rossii TaxID=123820 RepID=A0A380TNZ6_9PAST|nr:Branched-chain amino acid aminotransferase/4-amino-4-deoxychorismate lyase [[Actinobacillus] rossii]
MDFPLFETLCIEQQQIKNCAYHQQRYERTLYQFYGESAVKIYDLFEIIHLQPEFLNLTSLTRCRIDYNATTFQIQFFPYQRCKITTFQPVICDEIDYSLKFSDRTLLSHLLEQRGDCDEIIIIKQGKVTDCSIGNLVFRQGEQWFTPDSPLLIGSQRTYLLDTGKIKEKTIFAEDIAQFDEIRVINAMNGLV